MAKGEPLTDEDRWPWLISIRQFIEEKRLQTHQTIIIACSALKRAYRKVLIQDDRDITVVYLKGKAELIGLRLRARSTHFFDPQLLDSQVDALEAPTKEEAFTVDIDRPVEEVIDTIFSWKILE